MYWWYFMTTLQFKDQPEDTYTTKLSGKKRT